MVRYAHQTKAPSRALGEAASRNLTMVRTPQAALSSSWFEYTMHNVDVIPTTFGVVAPLHTDLIDGRWR